MYLNDFLTTDSSGASVSNCCYTPYGQERGCTGSKQSDFGFTGQRNEGSFGLMDYNARYYSPRLGRFVSPDTIVPDPGGSQGWNRYMYVKGNPIRFTDPTGHVCNESQLSTGTLINDLGCNGLSNNELKHLNKAELSEWILDGVTNLNIYLNDPPGPTFPNVRQAINLALAGKPKAFLGPNIIQELKNDPAMINVQNSLVSMITSDPRYGNEAFSIENRSLVGFGGIRDQGEVSSQLGTTQLWRVAGNELTFLVRNVYVNSSASVAQDGTIDLNHEFTDYLDLRPSPDRGWQYNAKTTLLGVPYHDVLGASSIEIHAHWNVRYPPQK